MTIVKSDPMLAFIRKVAVAGDVVHLSDGELLKRFIGAPEDKCFAELVRRHGPTVLRVCCQILRNKEDAEDAFQATFLLLSLKAGSVRRHESLKSWLYGVARRVASNLRRSLARRRSHEGQAPTGSVANPLAALTVAEAEEILHQELARLPGNLRAPLVLCSMEGRTRDEAAQLLRLPLLTLKHRLEQARTVLRKRLTSRGLTLPAALAASFFSEQTIVAEVPAVLAASTSKAAVQWAVRGVTQSGAGDAAIVGVSPKVALLAEGAMRAMFMTKMSATTLFVSGILVIGIAATLCFGALAVDQTVAHAGQEPAGPNGAPAGHQKQGRDEDLRKKLLKALQATIGEQRKTEAAEQKPVIAGGLFYRLPEDGMFAKFELKITSNWKEEGEKTKKGVLTMSSVGEEKVGDKPARWLEIKMETQEPGDHIVKALIPVENLKGGESPLDHAIKGWIKIGDNVAREITEFKGSKAGILPNLLPGALTGARKLPKKVVESKLGKLECVGRAGTHAFPWNNELRNEVAYETWLNDEAPFGVVSARVTAKVLRNDEEVGGWTMTLHLAEVGKGAKSELPGGSVADLREATIELESPARQVRWSRDGTMMVSFTGQGQDKEGKSTSFRIWDAKTGKLKRSVKGVKDYGVHWFDFSPDGKLLAISFREEPIFTKQTISGDRIELYDVETGELFASIKLDYERSWLYAAFSPNSRMLAVCGSGINEGKLRGNVRLFDVSSGELKHNLGGGSMTRSLAFSADGKWLAAGGHEGEITIWDLSAVKSSKVLGTKNRVQALAFSPDGKQLASVGEIDAHVKLWNLPTGEAKELAGSENLLLGHNLAFSADGRFVAADSDARRIKGTIYLWNADNRELIKECKDTLRSFAFAPDSRSLRILDDEKTIKIWNIAVSAK